MKLRTLLFFISLFFYFSSGLFAQESQVFDNESLHSEILNKEKFFSIYLPPGYEESTEKYPVVYLLHGYGSARQKHQNWIKHGDLQRKVDSAISIGRISPMIIVMPDAEMTYYMNNINGDYAIEDFIIKELIPYIDKNYRSYGEKKYRAISGLSMGGFGAMLYSLHHPELFSACAVLSPAIRSEEEIREMPYKQYISRYRSAVGDIEEGSERITAFWRSNDLLYLVENMPEDQKGQVRFYFDVGDDDFLYNGNSLMHILMRDLDIVHEYRVRDGGHNWEYWRSGLEDALEFLFEE